MAIAWGASTPAGATDVYASVSRDAGRIFGPPVRVNDVDGDARLNGEQPPRVAVSETAVTPAEAYGVATFYALFATTPRPPTERS